LTELKDECNPVGLQNSVHFGQAFCQVFKVADDESADNSVGGFIAKGQIQTVSDEPRATVLPTLSDGFPLSQLQHLR
jgi:hypothetical protein